MLIDDDRGSPQHMQKYKENDSKPTHRVPLWTRPCARVKRLNSRFITGGFELCCNFYFWRYCSIIPMLQHNFFWILNCSLISILQQKLNSQHNTHKKLFYFNSSLNDKLIFYKQNTGSRLAATIVNTLQFRQSNLDTHVY